MAFKTFAPTIIANTEQAATKSAQQMLVYIDPQTVDKTGLMLKFIKAAKKKNEVIVKSVIASDTLKFADISLDVGELTEDEAKVALASYYEIRDRKWGFWRGVGATVLAGIVLGTIRLFFFTS